MAREGTDPGSERERIREVTIDVVLERGNDGASVEVVIDRAGVDRAAFDRHFESLQDCILQAYWAHTDEFTVLVRTAFDREGSWRDSLRAAAYAAARYLRDHPRIVRSAEEFVPEMMYVAVRPYLGQEAARAELSIPPPEDGVG